MKLNFRRFVAILLVAMMTLTALPTAGIAEVMQDVSRESGSIRMLMVEPDDETYYTYEFYEEDGTTPIASQIVKKRRYPAGARRSRKGQQEVRTVGTSGALRPRERTDRREQDHPGHR